MRSFTDEDPTVIGGASATARDDGTVPFARHRQYFQQNIFRHEDVGQHAQHLGPNDDDQILLAGSLAAPARDRVDLDRRVTQATLRIESYEF